MKLQELLESLLCKESIEGINNGNPIELKELSEFFPNKIQTIVNKLWGTDKLLYRGQPFFKNEEYAKYILAAVDRKIRGLKIQVDVELPDDHDEVECEVMDPNEVYLGYDPKEDCLYIGYDAWIDVDSAWNDLIERRYDDEYDKKPDSFDYYYKELRKKESVCLLFKLKSQNGKNYDVEYIEELEDFGNFYRKIYKSQDFKNLKLIDLRLD